MIYSKRSFSRFMALTCLLGMASAGYNPSSDEKWDSDLEYRNNLRRVKSDPNMFEHGHLRLGRDDSAQSAPARTWTGHQLRRAVSSSNLHELANNTNTFRKWTKIVLQAKHKFIMFDLDQCILHRANGSGLLETRNGASAFVTYQEAKDRETAFHKRWGGKYRTLVTSKLPVGKGVREASPEDETWLLVIFRPGLEELLDHCKRNRWTIGVNTAMNPVHGQAIVEGFEDEFKIKVAEELRFFRTSTVRDTDPNSETYRAKNIKNYDAPTWLIRLHFNKTERKWFYQYKSKSRGDWVDLHLNEAALNDFCPDVVATGVPAIQDNMLPTYLSDALQYQLDGEYDEDVYQHVMRESGKHTPASINLAWTMGYYLGALVGVPQLFVTLATKEEKKQFNYPYMRDHEQAIWTNDIDEEDCETIHERLGEDSLIVHFDDKDFDVRLEDNDGIGNHGSLAWYPQSCKEDPKKAKKVRGVREYKKDMKDLTKLLC